jgi:uncharacterized protein
MSLINERSIDIERLCRKHKVKSLYAFGSVLTETFNDDSDVDLLVDFEPLQLSEYAQNYLVSNSLFRTFSSGVLIC